MKFTQVQIGQRFRYKGQMFRKETPLIASPVDEPGSRLIPRSAEVEPLEAMTEAPVDPDPVPWTAIDRAMDRLMLELNRIVSESGLDTPAVNRSLGEIQAAFVQARQQLTEI